MMVPNSNNVINLAELFEQVHGYRPAYVAGLPTDVQGQPKAMVPSTVKKLTNMYGEPLYGQADTIGREVFCPITIQGYDLDGMSKDYHFPYSVISFDRTKNVTATEMAGTDNEVDEMISNRSWQIRIKGFLIGQYEQFPDNELRELYELFEYNGTVRLKCALSDIFLHKKDSILLLKLNIPPNPGVIGVRSFSIQAKSSSINTLYV